MFEIQDSLAAQVAVTIAPTVREQELKQTRRKPPGSLSAYELMLQGSDLLYRLDPTEFNRARGFLQQALSLNPGYAQAH